MAHIFNIDGITINPATEEKQDDIISALGGGDAVELATEDKQDDIITDLALLTGSGKTFVTKAIDIAGNQTATDLVAAPAAGHHLEIYEVYLRVGGLGTVLFQEEDGADFTGTMPCGTNDLIFLPLNVAKPRYVCPTAAKGFQIDSSVDAAVDGHIIYVDVTD